MTKEECIRLVEAQLSNFSRVTPQPEVTLLNAPVAQKLTHKNDSHVVAVHELSNTEAMNSVLEVPDDCLSNNNSVGVNDITKVFEFKVPEAPVNTIISTNRRRSVRILQNAEKRKSIAPKLPSPPPPKRRRITINKKSDRQSIIGMEMSFSFKMKITTFCDLFRQRS